MSRIPLSQDEWVVCLEVYLRLRSPVKKPEERERSWAMRVLSRRLKQIGRAVHGREDPSYRPPAGVDRRVHDFAILDSLSGSRAQTKVPKEAKQVWQDWGNQPYEVVKELANAICAWLPLDEYLGEQDMAIPYEGLVANEGRILTRVHRVRERNQGLVRLKKEQFQDTHAGHLYCEACRFDFADSYPTHGEGFIECHHIKPLSQLQPNTQTSVEDLALLCANCHRMVHYRSPWLTMDGLSRLVLAGQTTP